MSVRCGKLRAPAVAGCAHHQLTLIPDLIHLRALRRTLANPTLMARHTCEHEPEVTEAGDT